MSKWEKVLVTLYRLTGENGRAVSYEDLVVEAFRAYPEDFGLRGYPEYPDASDIHKPLYNLLKPRGYVRISNKTFRLTESGAHAAEELLGESRNQPASVRLTRRQSQAAERYVRSSAVELVTSGKDDQLIDVDCQRFYGFAVWTKPREARALRAEFHSLLEAMRLTDAAKASVLDQTDRILYSQFQHLFEGATDGHSA